MLSGHGADSSSPSTYPRTSLRSQVDNLPHIEAALKKAKVIKSRIIPMAQGQNQHQPYHQAIANKQKTEPRIDGREH